MDQNEMKKLKLKCNKLIDEALKLEGRLKEKEDEIERLQKKKQNLEGQRRLLIAKTVPETPPEDQKLLLPILIGSKENTWERERKKGEMVFQSQGELQDYQDMAIRTYPVISQEKIMEMIQTLSAQLNERPREEFVIRKVSLGAKIVELFADVAGKLIKFIVLGLIMALLSLGVTILLNGQTREMIFEFVRNCMGGGM